MAELSTATDATALSGTDESPWRVSGAFRAVPASLFPYWNGSAYYATGAVTIRNAADSANLFRIDDAGNVIIDQGLTVGTDLDVIEDITCRSIDSRPTLDGSSAGSHIKFRGSSGGSGTGSGLQLIDTDNSHTMRVVLGADLTANRVFTLTTPNATCGLDISAVSGTVTISAAAATVLDDATVADMRTTLGCGTMATQAASAVAITGGSGAFTSGLGLTINQNATTTLAVTNTDATDTNSRAQVTIQAGTVACRMLALAGSSMVFGTTSAHDFILQRNSSNIASVLAGGISVTGSVLASTFVRPGSYTVGTVPSASGSGAGATIYVSNEAGGATIAFSNGTNWKRASDLATIS